MICKIKDVREFRPLSLPAPSGWKRLGVLAGVMAYAHVTTSMRVTVSLDTFEGGERFLHVAVSRRGRLPSWDDLKRVKTVFMGRDVDAFHIIPRADDHINMHEYTMHLWTPWEGNYA